MIDNTPLLITLIVLLILLFLFLVYKSVSPWIPLFRGINAKQIGRWISDRWIGHAILVTGLLMPAAQFALAEERVRLIASTDGSQLYTKIGLWTFFALNVLAFVIASLFQETRKERISAVVKERDDYKKSLEEIEEDFENTCKGIVVSLAEKLHFSNASPPTDRITVYSHDVDKFIPFGRYSYNQTYNLKGNGPYEDKVGCIARAWNEGHFFDNDFPDPVADSRAWAQVQKDRYGFKKPIARRIRMKSRLYFGWRVRDTVGQNPLAVILVESTNKDRWTEAQLLAFFEHEKQMLREVMERLYKRLPKMSIAAEEEF